MLSLNKEKAIISLTSGALTLASYLLLQKCLAHRKNQVEASKIYEEKALIDQYMVFNYARSDEFLTFNDLKEYESIRNCFHFPKTVALLCRDHCPDIFFDANGQEDVGERSALDIGCAVGRSCFELTKLFHSVLGIDYSENFIQCCNQLVANNGEMDYEGVLEGDLVQTLNVRLDPDVRLDRVKFEVGDACNLRSDLGEYDLVLASNLVCRLVEPKKFLHRLKSLVKSKRYAILSTPFTWGEQYTPKENWLGGYKDKNGNEVTGLDGLKRELNDSFDLVHQSNIPMMIRETKRKFQYTVCLITIWQKKF